MKSSMPTKMKKNWMNLPELFDEECAVVRNLKTNTDYLFRVRGVGNTGRKGQWSEMVKCGTAVGFIARGAATVRSFVAGL